ncbi:glycoside hydrolase family 15 protein [Sulfurovum sp.]|uniref:glycoside hydrolase family 15 protein n=1 Tax=Sulfurovum sp. TaxID=1969726 RepID=UPI0025E63CF4|nr:glycoside hydrolase family 15 protein [Sulfurovum sp.]
MQKDTIMTTLDRHYEQVEKIILSRQDPITGLLPASTSINAHGDYTDAWVRDNVYSILSVWGLALAYRKHDPDHYRAYLLSQSVVKLMRGLLLSMMRQSDKVETFKHSLNPIDALHAKYGTRTGLPVVSDADWGHLQLDATSLFLLMIAQMTTSGLQIVFTIDEVNFVQNLVHYISRTYCTPDYGIWERGHKINRGSTEINCSSVGMAKAALEAMDGLNLFGDSRSQEAMIHIVAGDVARSSFTLHSFLPRESTSKETDASLLSIIGYPAYAIEDEELVQRTREKIIKKLAGNYGCKRFLLDGHQTSIEDESRLHYEPSELRKFEHIESEWPLFFTYLLLDALMRHDTEAIEHWKNKLEPLFVEEHGQKLLPELYIVPEELIEAEKQNPGSQKRIPNENIPLVWAQSLYMVSEMILDGILHPNDIDPLQRRERIGLTRNNIPLIPVLAENKAVKQQLLSMGYHSETLEEVKPVKVLHASELSRVHTILGQNAKLSLSGKPLMVARTISTSRLHLLAGKEIVFLPYYFNPNGFYFSYDDRLLVEQFKSSLKFLAKYWNHPGQPIIPFLVREDMLLDQNNATLFKFLEDIQSGKCASHQVRTGPLAVLVTMAEKERIDDLHGITLKDPEFKSDNRPFCTLPTDTLINKPLTAEQLHELESQYDDTLIYALLHDTNLHIQVNALIQLWQRKGSGFELTVDNAPKTLSLIADELYECAILYHNWSIIRRIADISGKYDDRLEDVLLDIIIRQKQLSVGHAFDEKAILSKPMESTAIMRTISEFSGSNAAENVLTQEIMLHLGHLIHTEPAFFKQILTLRTWHFIQLLVRQIKREKKLSIGNAYEVLLSLAPYDIYERLRSVLNAFSQDKTLVAQDNLHASGTPDPDSIKTTPMSLEKLDIEDWMEWRKKSGMLGRLPKNTQKKVWYMLQQCNGIIIGDRYNILNRMGVEHTYDSTAGEQSFELEFDAILQRIPVPEYRQLNIEAIESLAWLFEQNPTFHLDDDLILDVLIGHAVRIYWKHNHAMDDYNEQRKEAWETFYRLSPQETQKAFVEAFKYLLDNDSFDQ